MEKKLNVVLKKVGNRKIQEKINNVINVEKTNSSKFEFLPDYIKNLYKMYFGCCLDLATFYIGLLNEKSVSYEMAFERYKKFIIEYENITSRFKADLDWLSLMIGCSFEDESSIEKDEEAFLYQVLEKRIDNIYFEDLQYNKREKKVMGQIQKEKRERAEDRRKLRRKKQKH